MVPVALTIAGSDPSGGAGVQADLKTFAAFGVHGAAVIAALTAQNTTGVRALADVDPAFVVAQLDGVLEDLAVGATKTGLLGRAAIVEALAERLRARPVPHLVVDPVAVATTGQPLGDASLMPAVRRALVPLATLVTPNLDEAALLVGDTVRTADEMERAARALVRLGAQAALIKGGHLTGGEVVDVLVAEGRTRRFTHPRLETTSTHGTGCTLSAAVTAGLALGRPLERAVTDALDFVHRAMAAAPGLGAGHGPLNHFVPAPPRPPTEGL